MEIYLFLIYPIFGILDPDAASLGRRSKQKVLSTVTGRLASA
jgi:hypothetical protein